MKKFGALLSFLIFLPYLPSCHKGETLVKATGYIKAGIQTACMCSTHQLQDSYGKLVYILKSSKVNLNDHIGKNVHIKGYILKGTDLDTLLVDVKWVKD